MWGLPKGDNSSWKLNAPSPGLLSADTTCWAAHLAEAIFMGQSCADMSICCMHHWEISYNDIVAWKQFHITGPLWGESTSLGDSPHSNMELWCSLLFAWTNCWRNHPKNYAHGLLCSNLMFCGSLVHFFSPISFGVIIMALEPSYDYPIVCESTPQEIGEYTLFSLWKAPDTRTPNTRFNRVPQLGQ